MPKLYLMMGIPGSGKSYWVEHHKQPDDVWISRDEIRFALVKETEPYFSKEKRVFNIWTEIIADNLKAGFNVFADATHINEHSRAKTLARMPIDQNIEYECIWLKTPIQQVLAQNQQRTGTRYFVPEDVIFDMRHRMTPPHFYEGFQTIYFVEPDKPIQIYKYQKGAE